jgi:hypothetical protein
MFLSMRKTRCRKVRGMLAEYIDNLLGTEDRGVVESHLEVCEACSNELESLQMTVQLLHRMPSVPVPRSFAVREVETDREEVSEPRGSGWLRPVPAFAVSRIDIGWASVCDPQRLRWLRPATAFATAALVLLLMLDFLQVVPQQGGIDSRAVFNESPAQIVSSPAPGGEEGTLEVNGDEPVEVLPPPVPTPADKTPTEDVDSGELVGGDANGGEEEVMAETAGGWPLRQIEIGIGIVLLALVTIMLFARRQRRSWSRV